MSEVTGQATPQNGETRDRAIGFFRLLRDFAQSRHTVVRQVDEYPDHLWFCDVPEARDCYTIARGPSEDHSEDVWLEVRHRPEPKCSLPPKVAEAWLKTKFPFGSNPDDEPQLYEEIREPESSDGSTEGGDDADQPVEPKYQKLDDHPQVIEAWDEYLLEKWLPWTEVHQDWEKHHVVYARLFSMHQAQLREGERFEVVLGLGCLLWLTPSGQRVARHVLTVPAVLEFDPNQGIFTVGPSHEGIKVSLELDMLEADERPAENLERDLRDSFKRLQEHVWDRETLDAVLRSIAKCLDDRADYDGKVGPITRLEQAPLVMFAPSLIYRRRSARGMVSAFTKIVEQLEAGGDIPPNVKKLAERSNARPTSGNAVSSGPPGENGVYFPCPSNREQLSIVEKLGSNNGILVQGPPGTGKSHTIANLVCHLLATGKRVLVTAQTPQALAVLRDKIPDKLKALCVSVLGHDRESVSHLEASVRGIADREATWNEEIALAEIRFSENSLGDLREKRVLLNRQLEDMRRAEVDAVKVAGDTYAGTPQSITQRVTEEAGVYGWLTDDIAPEHELPLQTSEFRELLEGLRKLNEERCKELGQHLPCLETDGISFETLPEQFRKERTYMQKCEELTSAGKSPHYSAIYNSGAGRREIHSLDNALKQLRATIGTVRNRKTTWVGRALNDVLNDNVLSWRELHNVTAQKVVGLAEPARYIAEKNISIPDGCDHAKLQADASDLKRYLESGGKLGLLSSLFNATAKRTKYVHGCVTVEGRPCSNIETLSVLLEWIDLERTVNFAWTMWEGKAQRVSGPLPLQIAHLVEHDETLAEVLAVEHDLVEAKKAVGAVKGVPQPTWSETQSLEDLFQSCQAVIAEVLAKDARVSIDAARPVVLDAANQDNAHAACRSLLVAIDDRDETGLRRVLADIRELERDQELLTRSGTALAAIAEVAPQLARNLETTASSEEWDDRLLTMAAAWRWAQARCWMNEFIAGGSVEDILRAYEKLSSQIGDTVEQLAATKAWANCIGRLSEDHRQNLVAWQQAIKRIGAGTGRHAERHRRAAQEHLAACQEAIPAWVMPMYRLYETIEPRPGIFDVIIVDEASQCGLDGLLLHYLGKQVVVVGDDEQISPTRITDHTGFQYLVEQYLPQYHLSSVLQPETSLFDLGEVWFRNRIVLREHFRCMPEIIRFSNDLCYAQTPLIPLRQYPADRVTPVKAVYVPDGCEHGSGQRRTNPAEAHSLVDAVVSCCDDPRYEIATDRGEPAKKTMGVISLLGDSQARLIENELIERLGPEEIEKRRLLCGDAYSFQGDERDVMFLSLVVAPRNANGDRSLPRAITAKQFKQRYNVAASRARDQMWLFHSVTLDDLRNPQDLRRRLLEHCLHPGISAQLTDNLNIEDLRFLAAKVERPQGTQPAPFESWFEVDVFLKIYDRGYRVVPQYPTLAENYRIDLVVEGEKPKLAIECDGDHWHGPVRFYEDMNRQRQLERAGWTFWRVRGSEYYADPDAALESLWRRLEHLGISPWSAKAPAGNGKPTPDEQASSRPTGEDWPTKKQASLERDQDREDRRVSAPPSQTAVEPAIVFEGCVPYANWECRDLQHPEESPLSEISATLAEIVGVEGPMVDYRAFTLYARAAGIRRMRRPVKEKLTRALELARRDGLVECREECGRTIVWCSGSQEVIVRERGERTLQEVPPSEIAEVMRAVLDRKPGLDDEQLIDELRGRLRINRLTNVTRVFLSKIREELVDKT